MRCREFWSGSCSSSWQFGGLLLLLFFLLFESFAQDSSKIKITWQPITKGMEYGEADAPKKSILNDSKISILKICPDNFQFALLSATEYDKKNRTATEWAEEFGLSVVLNAGMYLYDMR